MSTLLRTGVLAVALTSSTAHAANITVKTDGCNQNGCYSIHIDGTIQLEDYKKFEDTIQQYRIEKAVVYLNSDGGNVISGLTIGALVFGHKFSTYVPAKTNCVSICAAIWIAGNAKYVASSAHVGFHQPYIVDRRGVPHPSQTATYLMRDYYIKIGIPKPAADFFIAANPKDMYWLNSELAKGFKIEVKTIEVEEKAKIEDRAPITPKKVQTTIEQLQGIQSGGSSVSSGFSYVTKK